MPCTLVVCSIYLCLLAQWSRPTNKGIWMLSSADAFYPCLPPCFFLLQLLMLLFTPPNAPVYYPWFPFSTLMFLCTTLLYCSCFLSMMPLFTTPSYPVYYPFCSRFLSLMLLFTTPDTPIYYSYCSCLLFCSCLLLLLLIFDPLLLLFNTPLALVYYPRCSSLLPLLFLFTNHSVPVYHAFAPVYYSWFSSLPPLLPIFTTTVAHL